MKLKRGDRVFVRDFYSVLPGTVECTFTTDSNVKVRLDRTHEFKVYARSNVWKTDLVPEEKS